MADGNSYSGAVKNAEIVINQWIETAKDLGREIPQPKGKLMNDQKYNRKINE